jgi:uncharacterized protein YkwD
VHHRPASPPLTARVTGALARWRLRLRTVLRVRTGRLLLAGVVTTAVTALVLVLPVVSGLESGSESMVLDSSSSTTASPSADEGSPVVMGVDGRPIASSSFAKAVPSATAGETTAAAPGTTAAAPGTAAAAPGGSAATSETADAADASDPTTSANGSSAPAYPSTGSSSGAPSGSPSAGPSSHAPSPHAPSPGASAPERPAPDASAPPASAPPEESAEDDAEEELLELLDEARDDCASLDVDRSLTATARAHSVAMRDAGLLAPLEGGPAGSIAKGGTYAEDVLAGWLDDPTGGATILDCSRESVGIGVVDGAGGPWWTLLLA